MRFKEKLEKFLFAQIDNSQLIVFRLFFGLLIFLESSGAILTGWVKEAFVEVKVPLQFIGFEWLQPLPGYGMYFYYALMAILGLMVMTGFFYRFSVGAFTILWIGCYLMQKSHYNNHYYLLILLSLFMFIVPAHQYFSLDAKRNHKIKSYTCARWCVLIFILQLWIVFTYASTAKIQPDWLQVKPISIWFSSKSDWPLVGGLFQLPWFQLVIAYGGILFDGLIVPLLLWRRTRLLGLALCIFFNLFNSIVFQIGIFPYLMIVMTIFFFPAEKIRAMFLRKRKPLLPELLRLVKPTLSPLQKSLIIYGLSFYFIIQFWLPLRHKLFAGDVNWNEEGHRMSWRMMLRTKSGFIEFFVVNPTTGKRETFKLSDHFSNDQIDEIAKRPDMAWQAARFIKEFYNKNGDSEVEIYTYSSVSLNGRPYLPLIDPKVDLAKVEWEPFGHSEWILPYVEKK